ncbi:hypothetical protein FQN54_004360 [Arachnomyces sp. PD_36]|nr:hypothetical protein FQN54_004360 [Arachnomyces sp. PD_36]
MEPESSPGSSRDYLSISQAREILPDNLPLRAGLGDLSFRDEHYFTSDIWRIQVEGSSRSYYIHEDVLKRSSAAIHSACSKPWKETEERVYRFDKIVPEEVIPCFLNFAYRGNYAPTMARQVTGIMSIAGVIEFGHPIFLHAHRKIKLSLFLLDLEKDQDRDLALDLFEMIFETVPANHPLLTFLAEYAGFHMSKFQLSKDRFDDLLNSNHEFARHMQPRHNDPWVDPFECSDRAIMEGNSVYSDSTVEATFGDSRPRFSLAGVFIGFSGGYSSA